MSARRLLLGKPDIGADMAAGPSLVPGAVIERLKSRIAAVSCRIEVCYRCVYRVYLPGEEPEETVTATDLAAHRATIDAEVGTLRATLALMREHPRLMVTGSLIARGLLSTTTSTRRGPQCASSWPIRRTLMGGINDGGRRWRLLHPLRNAPLGMQRGEPQRGERDELRKRNYLPILFDFDKPTSQTMDETARMSRFVIADISDAKSVLQELRAIVPDLPSVPVQPVITATQEKPGMFDFFRNFRSFLKVHHYNNQQQLIADLGERVIDPAEKWRSVMGVSAGPIGLR